MPLERQQSSKERNAVSFSFRLVSRHHRTLFLLLTLLSCFFTSILIMTSTDFRLPGHSRHHPLLSDSVPDEGIQEDSEQIHAVIKNIRNKLSDDARTLYEKVRVLCIVITRRRTYVEKARHVQATWGRRCNKLIFMNSTTRPMLNLNNVTASSKTQHSFKYVHDHHLDDADWFLKADDDTYVVVENLRYLLVAYNSSDPVLFGHRFKSGYVSAGAGYVLSRRAVEMLVRDGLNPKACPNTTQIEDIEVAACLEKLGIRPEDSRDSQGRDRFFPIVPEDAFFPDYENSLAWYWNASYFQRKVGLECCSDKAISFRGIEPEQMYLLEYLIYHLKPHGGAYPTERAVGYPFS